MKIAAIALRRPTCITLLVLLLSALLLENVTPIHQSAARSHPLSNYHKHFHKQTSQLLHGDENAIVSRGGNSSGRDADVDGGQASSASMVLNLVKSIMGAAIFTVPAGMAAFTNSPKGILPACLLLAGIGGLSAYCFALIGRICAMTQATSYREAWQKSVSHQSSWLPHTSSLLTTLQAIVSYSIVLSSTLPTLVAAFGKFDVLLSRRQALLGITLFVLLPLCLMKSLAALAPFSMIGLLGLIYTAVAMTVRYFDGSYREPDGLFYQQLLESTATMNPLKSSFGTKLNLLSPTLFLLAAKIGNAYMAHYQAPTMYHELKEKASYEKLVLGSYGIVLLVYAWITAVGFGTFGASSQDFILSNYATQDTLLSLSRCAIFVSLLTSFPLAFVNFRETILSSFSSRPNTNVATVLMLSVITTIAYFVTDIGTLLSFGGGTYVCWLTFVFPPIMAMSLVKKLQQQQQQQQQQQSDPASVLTRDAAVLQKELPLAKLTLSVGVILSCIGTKEFISSQILHQ